MNILEIIKCVNFFKPDSKIPIGLIIIGILLSVIMSFAMRIETITVNLNF